MAAKKKTPTTEEVKVTGAEVLEDAAQVATGEPDAAQLAGVELEPAQAPEAVENPTPEGEAAPEGTEAPEEGEKPPEKAETAPEEAKAPDTTESPEKAPTATPWALDRVLKVGRPIMKGDDVKAVQTALIDRGFHCGAGGATGIYGKETAHAVRMFQSYNRLIVDGRVGKYTAAKLGGTWNEKK